MGSGRIKMVIRSLLFSYILTGILLLALAFALYKFRLKEGQVTIAVNAIYIITCLLGGFVIGKSIRQRRFFWGLVLGIAYFLVLFLVSVLMSRGISADMNQILMAMGVCAVSGTVGGMLS